jgi:hypothetical protein
VSDIEFPERISENNGIRMLFVLSDQRRFEPAVGLRFSLHELCNEFVHNLRINSEFAIGQRASVIEDAFGLVE